MGWGEPHGSSGEQAQLPLDEHTIEQRFRSYHAANPEVYDELVRLARELRADGYARQGIGMLWEVVRWQRMRGRRLEPGASAWKMNDNYRSRYARLIMAQEPDLAGVFETRGLRAA